MPNVEQAERALAYYEGEGLKVAPISTFEYEEGEEESLANVLLTPELTAKFYRCYIDPNYTT